MEGRQGSTFRVEKLQIPNMKLHKVKKRTAEPQNIEYRMSKGGFAPLSLMEKVMSAEV
jgi:hypothetical protein